MNNFQIIEHENIYDEKIKKFIEKELSIRYPDSKHIIELDFWEFTKLWLAINDEKDIVWTAWITTEWYKAELKKMFVDNDIRFEEKKLWIDQNEKLSQLLINIALKYCNDSWIQEVSLSTTNPFAIKFYEKNWFIKTTTNNNIFCMKKRL